MRHPSTRFLNQYETYSTGFRFSGHLHVKSMTAKFILSLVNYQSIFPPSTDNSLPVALPCGHDAI